MKNTQFRSTHPAAFIYIGFSVLLACLALFSIDRETKTFSDLFKTGNLLALLIYFLPVFFITSLTYHLLSKKMSFQQSFIGSLIIGFPVGFALIIFVMMYAMGRL